MGGCLRATPLSTRFFDPGVSLLFCFYPIWIPSVPFPGAPSHARPLEFCPALIAQEDERPRLKNLNPKMTPISFHIFWSIEHSLPHLQWLLFYELSTNGYVTTGCQIPFLIWLEPKYLFSCYLKYTQVSARQRRLPPTSLFNKKQKKNYLFQKQKYTLVSVCRVLGERLFHSWRDGISTWLLFGRGLASCCVDIQERFELGLSTTFIIACGGSTLVLSNFTTSDRIINLPDS